MPYAIGIDLGTSNSVVSVIKNGTAYVIPDEAGNRTHPSVVSFGHGQNAVVGNEALQQMAFNPQGSVYSCKRLIGRKFGSEEVIKARETVPYDIVPGDPAWAVESWTRLRVGDPAPTRENLLGKVAVILCFQHW